MPRQGISVLTEQTEQFIDENPTDLVLTRNTKVPDGAGGSTTSPTDLDPQTVRVIPQSRLVSVERRTTAGAVVKPDMNLICMPDADVQRGDTFTYNGLKMQVVWVSVLSYEKIAEVATF